MSIGYRRVHSEVSLRHPNEISLLCHGIAPMEGHNHHHAHDDILATYMDMEKIFSGEITTNNDRNDSLHYEDGAQHTEHNHDNKLRHSFSMDGFCGISSNNENENDKDHNRKKNKDASGEAKKAMSPDELAELWIADPKRAKRILANRQSAARSKERKARYIVELEKKVQLLQTEATALSAQLSLFERDTTGLGSENTELRRQLESMEQQAHLRDALNDALQQELDRLKVATGETTTSADAFVMSVQNIPYNAQQQQQQQQQQQVNLDIQKTNLLPLYPFESNMANPNHIDSQRSKMSPLHSFDFIDNSCPPSALNTGKANLHSSFQRADTPKVTSQQLYPFEANNLHIPHKSPEVPELYSLDASLYLPVDPSKPTVPHSCTVETNMHCPQANASPLRPLPQYPLKLNSLSPDQEVYVTSQPPLFAEMTSHEHLSKFQGLDLSGRGSHLVDVDNPSVVECERMRF